jgi:pimeloyl-ACP methyl ester carboxylesterase
MPELRTGQVGIHYELHGSGPAILFAHESTGDCANWQAQVEHFAPRHTCIVYNARGYPPSAVPASPDAYSQEHFVADMLAVLDHLQVAKAHVVGLSMGSMTSLHFGLRHPDRARSIVLAGTGPGQSRAAVEAFNAQVRALADGLETRGWAAILEDYDSAPDRRELKWKNPSMHRLYCDRLRGRDGATSATILREVVCQRPLLADLRAELRRMDLPVLIATGDLDADCLPTSLFLRSVLPRAGLIVFPRTGHAVNLEEPDLFNDLLERFYASISAGRW